MDPTSDSALSTHGTLAAFRELAPEILQELLGQAQAMELTAGQMLFAGEQPYKNAVFILREGDMELRDADGRVFGLEPGDVLGIDNYFDASPYTATATALTQVFVDVLPASSLRAAELRHPEIFNAFNRLLAERIRSQTTHPVTGVWSLPARTIMKAPLATRGPDTTVREAFETMSLRQIGSLGISDDAKHLLGLVTFVSLANGLVTGNARPDDRVLDGASEEPCLIDFDAPLWKVQAEQTRLGTRYLVVVEEGKPAGIISQTDILYALASYQLAFIAQIDEAGNFDELKAFNGRLSQIAQELRQNNRSAGMAVRALSEIHLAIQRRCIALVLDGLRIEGLGEPPVPFAFLIMGSGGRKEMMIGTDQDNGIILADRPQTDAPETRAWFMSFCDRVNHRMDEIGYDWCTGDIMARNPDFHKSLSEWRRQISQIAEIPTAKRARWSTIFFDFETLYGDDRLTVALRTHIFDELRNKPRLLTLMVEDDATGKPALGLFNRLVTASDKDRKGKIDLKRNGTRILADAARVYALSEGIDATNTGDRFSALVRLGRLNSAFVNSVLAAYDELLDLTLGHQLRQAQKGQPLDKLLNLEELTPLEEESLRIAMRVAKHLQGRIQGEFGTIML
jgi:CBS domain-containing protein